MAEFPRAPGLVTLTLTLDRVILHTVLRLTSLVDLYLHTTFIEIEETFCGRTDGHTDERTTFETGFLRSTQRSRPKNRLAP